MTSAHNFVHGYIIVLCILCVQNAGPIKFGRKEDQKVYVGYVLFKKEDRGISYLILKLQGQHEWVLPEGRVRFGETRQRAVKRVVREITGLLAGDVSLGITERMLEPENRTTYWIACLSNDEKPIKLHHHFLEYKWSKYDEAVELVNPLSKQLLKQTQTYVNPRH